MDARAHTTSENVTQAAFDDTPGAAATFARTLLTLLMCAHFTLAYMSVRVFLPVDVYAAGHVDIPFQYRVFPMLVMRALAPVAGVAALARRMPMGNGTSAELVMALLAFLGMLGAVYATRGTILRVTGNRSLARWMCLLVVIMSYFNLSSTWGLNYTMPYDVPSLCFFAVGVWLIVTNRIAWLYPAFALATLNRETSCFLILFFVVWKVVSSQEQGSRPPAKALWPVALHALLLSAIWVAIKVALAHFIHNSGPPHAGGVQPHLLQNVRSLLKPQQWPTLLSICGFTLPIVWWGRRWIRHDTFRAAASSVLLLWFAGMMIVGVLVEIRIFAEWAALITPLLALIVHHRFRAVETAG